MSYIQFEITNSSENDSKELVRKVFERANNSLKNVGDKEERVKLLQAWKLFEKDHGDEETLERVTKIMPRRVKKRVHYVSDDGVSYFLFTSFLNFIDYRINFLLKFQKDEGWEEKLDFVFPEDETAKQNMKILAQSKSWAKQIDDIDF